MPSKLPIYAKAPLRGRSANRLAREYGHYDREELAESLPSGAQVADIGAGNSPLGRDVCSWRDDIEWTNVDVRYNIPSLRKELTEDAPKNLRFLPGDVLGLSDVCDAGQFDQVYSYWLLPHILLEDYELGVEAAKNMLKVAKPTGEVAVGPCISRRAQSEHGYSFKADMAEHDPADLDALARSMATSNVLPLAFRLFTYATNRLGVFDNSPEVKPEYLHTPTTNSTLAA